MTEMLERVAEAIDPMPWSDLAAATWSPIQVVNAKHAARVAARHAIEAMREPTQAMVDEAEAADDPGSSIFGDPPEPCRHADAWRIMIDVALSKASPSGEEQP